MREEDGKAHGRRGQAGRWQKRTGGQTREEDGLADGRLSGGFREHLNEEILDLNCISVLFLFQM